MSALRPGARGASRSSRDQIALLEVPSTVAPPATVEIAKRRDHDLALAVPGEEVVRDRVALTGRVITVERDGALPIEVRGRLVPSEIREDRRQRLAPLDDV